MADAESQTALLNAKDLSQQTLRSFKRTREKYQSLYSRVFLYQRNTRFAEDAELAARGSFFLYLAGIPMIMGLTRTNGFFRDNEFFDADGMVMFVFTLYKTVGDTISFAFQGMLGTLLAACYIWIMFSVYPHGYTPEEKNAGQIGSVVWGAVMGTLFVVSILWLNFDMLTQIFGLSNFVWHWMTFMDTSVPIDYKHPEDRVFGFEFHLFGFRGIMVAFGGCMLAVIVVMLPFPLWAVHKAQDTADDIVSCLNDTWSSAVEFYCAEEKDEHTKNSLSRSARELKEFIGVLRGHVASSWWEVLIWPRWQRVRNMLMHLDLVTKEQHDRLENVVARCFERETFDDQHDRMMRELKEPMTTIISEANVLLRLSVQVVNEGGILSKQATSKETLMLEVQQRIRKEMARLRQDFDNVQERERLHTLKEGTMDEHVFGFEVCVYGRLVYEFAELLLMDAKARRGEAGAEHLIGPPPGDPVLLKQVKTVFSRKTIFSAKKINYMLRNALAILLGWVVGYFGRSEMILAGNAGIANTAAVLLSDYGGSAMSKNLGRLQGVVMGLVVGEVLYTLLGWCEWWAYAALSICVIGWTFVTLFGYYNSQKYGFISCLMAAIGSKRLLQGCSSKVVEPEKTYHDVISCVIAILIMTIVDFFLSLGIPSRQAEASLKKAWSEIARVMDELLDPNRSESVDYPREAPKARGTGARPADQPGARREEVKLNVQSALREVVDLITDAEFLGNEANEEPRWWRTPWRADLFNKTIALCHSIRLNVGCLIYTVTNEGDLNDSRGATKPQKDDWFVKILHMEPMRKLREDIKRKMEQVEELLPIFVHDELSQMKKQLNQAKSRFHKDAEEHLQEFMHQASLENVVHNSARQLDSPEREDMAQASFIVSCLHEVMRKLHSLHFDLLAA